MMMMLMMLMMLMMAMMKMIMITSDLPEQLLEEWVGSLEELLEGRQQTVEEARR